MRLFKKISYERFLSLEEKGLFLDSLNSISNEKKNRKISKVKVEDFNFYIVLEYINVFDSIDYDKIFPQKGIFIDYQSLQKEQNNVIAKIKKRFEKKNNPEIFNRLGVTNFVKGCYLVGGNINEIPKRISRSSGSIVSVKLNYNNLPKEIIDLCDEFYNKQLLYITKEQEEFEQFFKLTSKEQEKLMSNFFEQFSSNTNKKILFSYSGINHSNNSASLTFDELFSQNLDFFVDKEFLNSILEKALQDENYEICAKIKKRLEKLG